MDRTVAYAGTTLMLTIASALTFGQNLVPNYSFEDHSDCPEAFNLIELSAHWHKSTLNNVAPHHVDYIHTCGSGAFEAPDGYWGFQAPATGEAHEAISTRSPLSTDYRENIFAELIAPLIPGVSYTLSMKVSHTDLSKGATNNLGIKLANSQDFAIDNTSHLHSVDVLDDNENWFVLSGTVVADDAYTHVGVGNFYTDANTIVETVCPSCPYMHNEYYIDDICVAPTTEGRNPVLCNVPFDPASAIDGTIALSGWSLASAGAIDGTITLLRNPRYNGPFAVSIIDASGRVIEPPEPVNGPGPFAMSVSSLATGCYALLISGREKAVLRFVVER